MGSFEEDLPRQGLERNERVRAPAAEYMAIIWLI
jgi:hypothetical protein